MYKNLLFLIGVIIFASCARQPKVEWISSTPDNRWMEENTDEIFGGGNYQS